MKYTGLLAKLRTIVSRREPARSAASAGAALLGLDTALVVVCCNRAAYLKKTLAHVLAHHPLAAVPVVISQDGNHATVSRVVDRFRRQLEARSSVPVRHLRHRSQKSFENGYFALAAHFKWALDELFADGSIQRVIILEDDLQIAPDFFEYFAATMPFLDADPSLMAVSTWNDNGSVGMVRDPKQLYRTDFFPGLGWMLPRRIWEELTDKWPRAYWDDWLREPAQRQGRQFIRPEICRTFHFGKKGVSNAQYWEHFNNIQLNSEYVPFTSVNLDYLRHDIWKDLFLAQVRDARPILLPDFYRLAREGTKAEHEVRIAYSQLEGPKADSFAVLARSLGVMDSAKANVPRTAYQGIVSFWKSGRKVHLVPQGFD